MMVTATTTIRRKQVNMHDRLPVSPLSLCTQSAASTLYSYQILVSSHVITASHRGGGSSPSSCPGAGQFESECSHPVIISFEHVINEWVFALL